MNIILILKKIALIFFASIIFFTGSFAFPITQQKAEAAAFGAVIPAGITVGAGAYAVGALGLAGLVGIAGYSEHSDAINAHAKGVWEGGTQTAKDSLNWSIEQAKNAGNGVVQLQADFINFMESKLQNIASNSANLMTPQVVISDGTYLYVQGVSPTYSLQLAPELVESGQRILVNGRAVTRLQFHFDPYTQNRFTISFTQSGSADGNWIANVNRTNNLDLYNQLKNGSYSSVKDRIDKMMTLMGVSVGVGQGDLYLENYNNALSKTREQWETMRDAGLVLPVDSAVPLNSIDGTPLNYNPTTDSYTGIDGGVYTGTPAWAFPTPKIRVANPDIPGSVPTTGVYVDTPVLTGNPTYDDAIVNNPAIPKTTTNVNTGVTVGNPDYVGNPPVEGEVPPSTNPPPSKWEKPPTKKPPNIGALITTKFPFSLPFDFFGVLGWLNAEPKAPVFKIDTGIKSPLSEKEVKLDMEFKFNFLDPYMGFFRSFIIIGFSLFLILATRKLLGGAG